MQFAMIQNSPENKIKLKDPSSLASSLGRKKVEWFMIYYHYLKASRYFCKETRFVECVALFL